MKVQDVMHKGGVVCGPDMNLTEAAAALWKNGCGCLPVVGEGGNVIGMITDRDICIALARRGEDASRVPVWEAMQHKLFTCSPEDNIHCALKTFRAEKICRLLVVDREGVLQGILCMDDIVLTAQPFASKHEISFEDVAITYQAICRRNYPEMIRRAPAA